MRTRTQIICICLAAAVFMGFRILRFSEPPGLDQGLFAYFGQRIPEGDIPYRDIWDSKPPAVFYLYALAFFLFGSRPESISLFESFYLAATAIGIYGLTRHLFGKRAAIFATMIAAVFPNAPLFGGFWSSAQAETFMGLPIVGSVWLVVDRSRRGKSYALVLSGVLLGLAICLKVTAILFLPLFLGYLLLYPPGGCRSRAILWLVGLALPLGIVAAYFRIQGALGELWYAVTVYSWHYAREIARHQNLLWAAIHQAAHFVRMNPTVWVLSTIGAAHLLWKRRSPETLFALSWLALSFLIVWAQRQFAGYHFLLLVTPLASIAGHGVAVLPDLFSRHPRPASTATESPVSRPSMSVRPILLVILLALVLYLDLRGYVDTYRPNLAYMLGRMSRDAYGRIFDRGTISYGEHRAVGRYIRDRTSDQDPLLVWGLAPAIYFFAERPAATRYVFHHVLLTDAPLSRNLPGLESRRNTFMHRLYETKPKYIVVGLNDPNGFEPQDSYRQMLAFPAFQQYAFANYRPERQIGNFLLLRREEIQNVEIPPQEDPIPVVSERISRERV